MKQLVWEEEGIFLTGGGNQQEAMESGTPFQDVCTSDLTFDFGNVNAGTMSYSSGGRLRAGGSMWPQSLTPSISASIDSQSSMCGSAGSPTSPLKPNSGVSIQGPGGASISSKDLTDDDEDQDIEAGPCEQSGSDVIIIKKMRRKVSNRESARRSRRRKQAHLAGLELQVDQLRGENASLYKQLTDAGQQFNEAATDNRVLKSDVEALRMKVKLAQDYITRESLNCGLNHLLQSHATSANQALNARNMCCTSDITTTLPGQIQNFGLNDKESHTGSSRDCRLSQNALDATTTGAFADQNFW